MKCPLCHTNKSYFKNMKVGKCICGTYLDAVTEDTWKEPKWLEMHEQWEAGKLGYNMIYSRLRDLYPDEEIA